MEAGGFYAGRAYASSISSGGSPLTAYPSYPDASNQKLDQIVALIQAQSQETAAIRSELSVVKYEVASLKESACREKSHSPQTRPKIPSELSVRF